MTSNTRFVLLRKLGIVLAGVGVLALASSGTAMAGGQGRGGHYLKKVSAKLDQALQAVQASAEQKATIEQAKLQAFAAIKPIRKELRQRRAEIRELKGAQQPDQARLQQLKTERAQLRQQIHAAAQGFMQRLEETLSAPQRKALADFVQQNGPIFQQPKQKS